MTVGKFVRGTLKYGFLGATLTMGPSLLNKTIIEAHEKDEVRQKERIEAGLLPDRESFTNRAHYIGRLLSEGSSNVISDVRYAWTHTTQATGVVNTGLAAMDSVWDLWSAESRKFPVFEDAAYDGRPLPQPVSLKDLQPK